jgi:hypothetical protein
VLTGPAIPSDKSRTNPSKYLSQPVPALPAVALSDHKIIQKPVPDSQFLNFNRKLALHFEFKSKANVIENGQTLAIR